MKQDKISVGTRISPELANRCKQDYGSVANALNAGLELLYKKDVNKSVNNDITHVNTVELLHEEKDKKITDLQSQIETLEKDLRNNEPNIEIYEVQLRDKDLRITDLQAHNETLKKELEDNKQMHNNYMLQVQTIINQRAIEAPGAKKWWQIWK
jgi:chromosome segregation ATPase